MKLDSLSLLFCLYVLVLVLMSIKYLFTKTKLTNTDIVIHLLVIVVLGLLVAFTNKKEHFLNPSRLDYKIDPLHEVKCGQKVAELPAANLKQAYKDNNLLIGKVNGNPVPENNQEKVACRAGNVKGDYGEDGSPLNYKMGPYSGVVIDAAKHQNRRMLIPGLNRKLRINRDEVGLFENPKYTDPLGEEAPLNLKYKSGPPVDGDSNSPNAMFMFAHNKCHPGCCPSSYSCDHGCVCTTEKQRDFIANKGIARKD